MKFTDIVVLLDRSSSMYRTAAETRISFNTFLADQQNENSDEARITLMQFAGPADQTFTYRNHSVKLATGLTPIVYDPNGTSTALRDAMSRLIDERGREYASVPAESRPEKVVFVVITDGEDNASRVTPQQIKAMVEHQTSKYSWEFIYLGAGHDAITIAQDYGFEFQKTMEYSPSRINYTAQSLSSTVSTLRSAPIGTYTMAFTKEDRDKSKDESDKQ